MTLQNLQAFTFLKQVSGGPGEGPNVGLNAFENRPEGKMSPDWGEPQSHGEMKTPLNLKKTEKF